MSRYPQNTLILTKEPFVGYMPNDVRQYLTEHPDDRALANAMAEVWNQAGILGHELDETDDHWIEYAFWEWQELEHELFAAITARMEMANQCGEAPYDLTKKGIWLIEQFMLRNGYYNGSGWWCKQEKCQQGGASNG